MALKISFLFDFFSHEGGDPTEDFLVDLAYVFDMGFQADRS
jgi:hypothetical protein